MADIYNGYVPAFPVAPPLSTRLGQMDQLNATAGSRPAGARKTISLADDDLDYITRVINAETPASHGDVGRQGVLFTILNRTAVGGQFGQGAQGVLNARNQFEPVLRAGGDVRNLPAPSKEQIEQTRKWIEEFQKGNLSDPTKGALYFQNPAITSQRGTNFANGAAPLMEVGPEGQKHAFYNRYKGGPAMAVPNYTVVIGPDGRPKAVPFNADPNAEFGGALAVPENVRQANLQTAFGNVEADTRATSEPRYPGSPTPGKPAPGAAPEAPVGPAFTEDQSVTPDTLPWVNAPGAAPEQPKGFFGRVGDSIANDRNTSLLLTGLGLGIMQHAMQPDPFKALAAGGLTGMKMVQDDAKAQAALANAQIDKFVKLKDLEIKAAEYKLKEQEKTRDLQNAAQGERQQADTLRGSYETIKNNWSTYNSKFLGLPVGRIIASENVPSEFSSALRQLNNLNTLSYTKLLTGPISEKEVAFLKNISPNAVFGDKAQFRDYVAQRRAYADILEMRQKYPSATNEYLTDIYKQRVRAYQSELPLDGETPSAAAPRSGLPKPQF